MDISALRLDVGSDTPCFLSSDHRPPSWPPPPDFPVVVDALGAPVSLYSDAIWDFTLWARKPAKLQFDTPSRKLGTTLCDTNADLLRQIAAWWLWGPHNWTLKTFLSKIWRFRPVLDLCSRESIAASDLWRFPRVLDELPSVLSPSSSIDVLAQLHLIYEHREELGFFILDREGLRRLSAALPRHISQQTPYIPPRIWAYQVNRLRTFLDEFHAHKEQLDACYSHCLSAYAEHYDSIERAFRLEKAERGASPFSARTKRERFSEIAARFGVDELLRRWLLGPSESLDKSGRSVSTLSAYFSMVGKVGIAYILNHTMMRIEEAWSLRCDCLNVEHDERFGDFYTICGPTTKTIEDSDARWVASPSVEMAVNAMAYVSRLRAASAAADPGRVATAADLSNPHLLTAHYEPWANARHSAHPISVRHTYPSYKAIIETYPKLFDPEQLRIRFDDLSIARSITPTLDSEIFKVGNVWPLAWHQLRRTGAVNLQATGVSDASIQYQLKHAARAMSLYYGQGYSRVRLNERTRATYIRTMYETLSAQLIEVDSNRFLSPFGNSHRDNVLKLVTSRDHKQLVDAARDGNIAWRETLLGVCTHRGPCEYGGIDHVSRCGGGDGRPACADLLIDRTKKDRIRRLSETIAVRLLDAPEGSPYKASLEAQKRSVETALNVIAHSE